MSKMRRERVGREGGTARKRRWWRKVKDNKEMGKRGAIGDLVTVWKENGDKERKWKRAKSRKRKGREVKKTKKENKMINDINFEEPDFCLSN